MSYDLGTARGSIVIDPSGAVAGSATAARSMTALRGGTIATSSALMTAGRHLTIVGGLAVAGFGLAVNAAMKFDKEMSNFKAISEATESQMDAVRETALRLGRDTSFSANEAAQALSELSKAGLTTDQILNGAADAAVMLAEAGGIDIPTAATVAANAMNTFNISAEDMMSVADSFAGTANRTATDVQELSEAIRYTGASASLLNIPIEDVNTALGILANRGLRGSIAGTNLNRMLINLNPASDKAAEAMRELGIITEEGGNQFFDAEGKAKSLGDISQVLQDSLRGLTDQQKLQKLETIFGSRALQAASALAEEGVEGFTNLKDAIGDVSAEDVAQEKLNNLSGSIEILRGSVETFLINAGEGAQGPLKSLVDFLTRFVNVLAELNPTVLQWGLVIVGAAGGLLMLAGIIVYMVGALMKFKLAMQVLNVGAFLTSPILLVILALAALAAAFIWAYNNVEWFRDGVDGVIQSLKPTFEAIKAWVINAFNVFVEEVLPKLISFGKSFLAFMQDIITTVMSWGDEIREAVMAGVNGVVAAWDWLWSKVGPVVQAIGELFGALVPKIVSVVKAIVPYFKGAFNAIKTIITTAIGIILRAWDLFGDNILTHVMTAFNLVKATIKSAMQIIKGIINVVTGILTGDWSKAWEGIKSIFAGVWTAIQGILVAAWSIIRNIFFTAMDAVRLVWHEGWNVIKAVFSAIWSTIKGLIQAGWNVIRGIWNGALNFIKSAWNAAWRNVSNFLKTSWETIKNTVTTGINNVVNFLRGLPNRAYQAISALVGKMADRGREAMQGLRNAIGDKWQAVVTFLQSIPGRVSNFFSDAITWLADAGREIITGLWEGMKGVWEDVKGWVGGLGGWISDHKGPIEVDAVLLRPHGNAIMEGLKRGLDEGWVDIMRKVASMGINLQSSFLPSPSALSRSSGPSSITHDNRSSEAIYKVEAHTDADPEAIMDSLMWMSAVKA